MNNTFSFAKVIVKQESSNQWLAFSEPVEFISAWHYEEVDAAFAKIASQVEKLSCYAAGYIQYEAAKGFDDAFESSLVETDSASTYPLLCFGLYTKVEPYTATFYSECDPLRREHWQQSETKQAYLQKFEQIKAHILSGDTYQLNYTLRQYCEFNGDPESLIADFAFDAPYGAYIDMGDHVICSASPELFFELKEGDVTTRPMKGTARRGLDSVSDEQQRKLLFCSEKDRAENIMIVDMIRNDLSKVADIGSVAVSDCFKIERYPTVWQMTTTVKAKTKGTVVDVMRALFPCASITGAPKVKTMSLINSLENYPRGIYTGTIGFIEPNGNAQFNVAIRTASFDKNEKVLRYGMGGGIVADSEAFSEYEECLLKAEAITKRHRFKGAANSFSLLETMLWQPGQGCFLQTQHLRRLTRSAAYFGWLERWQRNTGLNVEAFYVKLVKKVESVIAALPPMPHRIRLLVNAEGEVEIESYQLQASSENLIATVSFASAAVDSNNCFLYHKTTNRGVYETARGEGLDAPDVIMWNERDEVTESTIANIVIKKGKRYLTPKVSSGLLAGTYREYLLARGEIEEATIFKADLENAEEIALINSVRKWQTIKLK